MFIFKQIKYTLDHRKAFRKVEKELLVKNTLSSYLHNFDKVFLYLFFDYQKVHVDYEIKQVFDNYRYVEYNDI